MGSSVAGGETTSRQVQPSPRSAAAAAPAAAPAAASPYAQPVAASPYAQPVASSPYQAYPAQAAPPPIPVTNYAPPPAPQYPQARALYPFVKQNPPELSFNAGDILKLLNTEGAWWQAELNGQVGLIPNNYVQRI